MIYFMAGWLLGLTIAFLVHVYKSMVHFLTNAYGFTEDDYGKTVFLTKEETEEALRRLQGNE